MEDIFALAKQKQNLVNNAQVAAPPMLNMAGNQKFDAKAQSDPDQSKLQDILTKPSSMSQSKQDVMNLVSSLDLGAKEVPMSQVGKDLILSKLQSRYGDSYKNMPEVQNMLSAFDNYLSRYSDEASKTDSQLKSQADSTLSAIKDWGNNGSI